MHSGMSRRHIPSRIETRVGLPHSAVRNLTMLMEAGKEEAAANVFSGLWGPAGKEHHAAKLEATDLQHHTHPPPTLNPAPYHSLKALFAQLEPIERQQLDVLLHGDPEASPRRHVPRRATWRSLLDETCDPRRWGGICAWAQGIAERLKMIADGLKLCENLAAAGLAPSPADTGTPSAEHREEDLGESMEKVEAKIKEAEQKYKQAKRDYKKAKEAGDESQIKRLKLICHTLKERLEDKKGLRSSIVQTGPVICTTD